MENNITTFTGNLVDLFNGIKDGSIDTAKAKALNATANNILQSAKIQSDLVRSMKGAVTPPPFLRVITLEGTPDPILPAPSLPPQKTPETPKLNPTHQFKFPKQVLDQKLEFANHKKCKGYSEAISKFGQTEFEKMFREEYLPLYHQHTNSQQNG